MYSQKSSFSDISENIEYNHFSAKWSCENDIQSIVLENPSQKSPNEVVCSKKPRTGTFFTPIQLDELERFYSEKFAAGKRGRYLVIANYLNLEEHEVYAWFRNRTCKERRGKLRLIEVHGEKIDAAPAKLNDQYAAYRTHSFVERDVYETTSNSPYDNVEFFEQSQENQQHLNYAYDFSAIEMELMRNYEFEVLQNEQSEVMEEFSNVNFDALRQLHSCKLSTGQSELLNPADILEGIDQSEFEQYI